jgi:CheY-like chemotaxis protein
VQNKPNGGDVEGHRAIEPRCILVAEDDADVRDVLTTVLEHAGYTVEAFATGDDALLRLVEQDNFSLLLTDIRMPGSLDGWTLAQRAKACRPDLRIVYMTGYSLTPPDKPGLGPLLPKPWKPSQLVECVRRALDQRSENRAGQSWPSAIQRAGERG